MRSEVVVWSESAAVVVDGATRRAAEEIASRWGGSVRTGGVAAGRGEHRLEVPAELLDRAEPGLPGRARRMVARVRRGFVEVGVGPHRVLLDPKGRCDRIVVSPARALYRIDRDTLLAVAISHLLAVQGLSVLHSCAFELAGSSVIGLGESFAGKTTVSVAAMRAGGRVTSDDAVLVVPGDRGCSVLPVRSWGWLRGRTREIVPDELREEMIENEENGEPRWVLDREAGGDGFVDSGTPDVVWVQSVDRRLKESRIEAVDQGQVFAALIRASSPLFLSRHCPEIRDRLIPVFRALCEQCRGYRVRLAPRLLEEPVAEMKRLMELSR